MKPADAEPETSLRSPRNNALLMRLRCNYFNPIFNPPIQPSFHDSNQKLNFQKDAEKPTGDLPGKVVKKRKFPFADETAADANVNCCLRNMEATAKFSSLSMKIGEEREVKNKETTKFSVVLISDKDIEDDDVLTFFREMPPRNPNNPPTQDVENPTEAVREKPTIDDDDNGVAEKKRKVSSADETAANVNVRPRNLRNKKPTCSLSLPMELIKAYEENSDEAEAENHEIANFSVTVSEKNKEEYFSALTGKKPSRKPKKKPRNRNMQKAIDQVLPALDISEIIDEVMIQRWRGLHWWRGSKAFYR